MIYLKSLVITVLFMTALMAGVMLVILYPPVVIMFIGILVWFMVHETM
jgi:hypothetical protein